MYCEPHKLWCKIFRKKYLDLELPSRILTVANLEKGFATWNFLWECKSLITDHISWQIGNGCSAKFWYDSWDGDPTIYDLINDHAWIQMVESHIGSLVHDYFDTKLTDGKIRRWKLVSLGNPAMCSQLRNILNSRHIPVSNDDDNIFWCGYKTREYNVKLGYEAQRIRSPITSWPHKLCWNNRLLPKAGAFLWISLHN
ncbi:hypothetical protein SUGI_0060020 [Cryptomeria japonica]|nr:hypothetical protein SUGI_0060020 [Cryptomeria japonica]